jgi:Fe-S-cluster containining protein
MRLVTDPTEVQRLAENLEDENWAFRSWIKASFDINDRQLMSVVSWLAREVTARIDCTTCGNCCQVLAPPLKRRDLKRLAGGLDLDVPTLEATYLQQDESGKWELPAPCPLLEGKLCRVYDARPKPCREYPHLHNDFRSHSIARIQDTFICPIVFNVVEGMKVELEWDPADEPDWDFW